MNLFFIGTPLQLLNATEARQFFEFTDNHLIIALDLNTWPKTKVFARLIRPQEWASVRYITLHKTTVNTRPRFLGPFLSTKFENVFYKFHQYLNKSCLQRLARSFPAVDNLVLGNYHADQSRHFPHLVKHNRLYLVDDGTDVLYINEERRNRPSPAPPAPAAPDRRPALRRLRSEFDQSLRWNKQQAESLTFFSAYNLTVRNGDQAVKNEYHSIRKRIVPATRHESCLFLGQCLVLDGFLDEDAYVDCLKRVGAHFQGQEVIYVPHPREAKSIVDRVQQQLGFTIRRFELPVEWQLLSNPVRPVVLASFFCSALVTCAAIFRDEFKLKAFYIPLGDIQKWPGFVEETYHYFSTQMAPLIEVVGL
ncbi:MAG: polysialyltransferase family glycosyltransferase [Opitutaceae bacterium]|jgi:hypothetical protein